MSDVWWLESIPCRDRGCGSCAHVRHGVHRGCRDRGDHGVNTNDSGPGSLRQAIVDAGPGEGIAVPAGTYTLTTGELTIAKSLTITGSHNDTPGADHFLLAARQIARKLAPGPYRLQATPRANGLAGHTLTATLRIVAPSRQSARDHGLGLRMPRGLPGHVPA